MRQSLMLGLAAALSLAACGKPNDPAAGNANAAEAAGDETLATALGENAKFAAAVKAAGLEATLAGPGPYTLLAPSDAAFEKLLTFVRDKGTVLPDDDLHASDVILPPADMTFEEAGSDFTGEGLVPDPAPEAA